MTRTLIVSSLLLVATHGDAQRVLPLGDGMLVLLGVYDMVEYDGKLVVGGMYGSFLGNPRRNIQAWDGMNHFDLPGAFTGVSNRVRALEVFNGALIAAGNEPGLGHVARWDGTAWQAMGAGLTAQARALCVHNNELYAAGTDSMVSRWTGSEWVPVGNAFNGIVAALESHGGQLYAAGAFDHDALNTVELRRLVRWNGATWTEVAYGLNDQVTDLLSTPDGLVVTGSFSARGDGVRSFPLWTVFDGTTFIEPIQGPSGTVIGGVSAHPDGGFILGGDFGDALWVNGTLASKIRMGTVRAVIEFGGDILLGGESAGSYAPVGLVGRLVDGVDEAVLDANGIAATLTPTSGVFQDHWSFGGSPGFEAPKGDGVHSIYSAAPWVVGEHSGTLHSSAPWYGQDTVPLAGPNANVMDAAYYERYFQVWKLDQPTIGYHALHYADAGYVMPHAIASWPGNGDVGNGEPALLAPFADLNNNERYEPEDGEYPLIRGRQAVYYILHSVPDMDGLHPGMTLDIEVMHYAYDDPSQQDLYNTVFSNYRMINRGTEDYTNVRFGAFTDFDLGSFQDDLAGCDSSLSLFHVYNGDAMDDSSSTSTGYGADIPAQGVMFLNHPMTAHRVWTFWDNAILLEDAMNGTTSGTPFTQLGYPTHFQFPGGAWTEQTSGNAPGDRRSVGSVGPFTLAAGGSLCVDLAYPFARAESGDPLDSRDGLLARAAALRTWYAGQAWDCSEVLNIITGVPQRNSALSFSVFPNPTRERFTVQVASEAVGADLRVLDPSGRQVWTGRLYSTTMTFDVAGLRNGCYLLEMVSGEGLRQVQHFIVAD